MTNLQSQLSPEWLRHLKAEFTQPYMQSLTDFLVEEKELGKVIFPAQENLFNALNTTAIEDTKVVILGQDPYHGEGQAHGLSFSVPESVKIPPSLRNIYKEVSLDIGCNIPLHGNLQGWAEQGVLLLNSVLTVEEAKAGSHQNNGWEQFTDAIISTIDKESKHVVFLLWGSYAQKKGSVIDQTKHLVLNAPHPSPLSSHRGFFGCRHFSKTNTYLQQHNITPIDWDVLNKL